MTTVTETQTIDWPGKSGTTYRYWIYPIPPNFQAAAGNYIFAKQTKPGYWVPVYIGETENLNQRFDDHHKMPCIVRNGATHIHAHLNANSQDRLNEEADLISNWNPSCNG